MSYTPNNVPVYLAAYNAIAGFYDAQFQHPVDYAELADAWAQALDTAWGAGSYTSLELALIGSVSVIQWQGQPIPEDGHRYVPSAYADAAADVIALVKAGNAQVVAEGIDPNVTPIAPGSLQAVLWNSLASIPPALIPAYQPINGRSAIGDGGQGQAFWNPTDTRASDGGTVIQVTGIATGRWNRVQDPGLSFNVQWFGANDSSSDNAPAINAASAAAFAASGRLYMPPGANFAIQSTITIMGECECSGSIVTTAGALNSGACLAMIIGSRATATNNAHMRLPDVVDGSRTGGAVWTAGRVGIELANLTACEVFIGNVWQFAIGVHHTSGGSIGSQDNTVFVRSLVDNEVQLKLEPLSVTDFVAENLYIGGTFNFDSSVGVTPVAGTRQILIVSTALGSCDGNYFLKCDIEGNVPEFHVECQGTENSFVGLRWETNVGGGIFPKVWYRSIGGVGAERNAIQGGVGTDQIVFSGDGANNILMATEGWFLPLGNPNGSIIASNENSNGDPVITVMPSGWLTSGVSAATAWGAQLGYASLNLKLTGDAHARVFADGNHAEVLFGVGVSAPASYVGINGVTGDMVLFASGVDADIISTGIVHVYSQTSNEMMRFDWSNGVLIYKVMYPGVGGVNLGTHDIPFNQIWAGGVSVTSGGIGGNPFSGTALEMQAFSGNPINLNGAVSPVVIGASAAASPFLGFTGTMTGDITLQFPNVNGLWFCDVSALVLGGHTLTFQSGTTTRSVTVLPANGLIVVATGVSGSNTIAIT